MSHMTNTIFKRSMLKVGPLTYESNVDFDLFFSAAKISV